MKNVVPSILEVILVLFFVFKILMCTILIFIKCKPLYKMHLPRGCDALYE